MKTKILRVLNIFTGEIGIFSCNIVNAQTLYSGTIIKPVGISILNPVIKTTL